MKIYEVILDTDENRVYTLKNFKTMLMDSENWDEGMNEEFADFLNGNYYVSDIFFWDEHSKDEAKKRFVENYIDDVMLRRCNNDKLQYFDELIIDNEFLEEIRF